MRGGHACASPWRPRRRRANCGCPSRRYASGIRGYLGPLTPVRPSSFLSEPTNLSNDSRFYYGDIRPIYGRPANSARYEPNVVRRFRGEGPWMGLRPGPQTSRRSRLDRQRSHVPSHRGRRTTSRDDASGSSQRGCHMYRIWVPDLDSPSYFVAIAAVELGFFKQEGIDIEFIHNTNKGPELMREGKLDFIAGPAFAGTRAFPSWKGIKLLCALSQYSYWFMAVRSTLDVKRGDLQAIKGLRISAAPAWPEMSLRYMLVV